MAARAPAASATDAYTVPDWVEKNSRIFKKPPPEFEHSTVKRGDAVLKVERDATLVASLLMDAAVGGAEVTDDTMDNIDLPFGPQPAEYWRNVVNHGNVLATLISVSRRKSGFIPHFASDKEQAEEYARKFEAWLQEIESYLPYIQLVRVAHESKENTSPDCDDKILKEISDFVVAMSGAPVKLAEALSPRIQRLVKSAADLVTQHGTTVHAGLSFETTETSGGKNPIHSITFASTTLRNNTETSKTTLLAFVYQLNSDAIISIANMLSSLSGSKQYRDYVNAPLN